MAPTADSSRSAADSTLELQLLDGALWVGSQKFDNGHDVLPFLYSGLDPKPVLLAIGAQVKLRAVTELLAYLEVSGHRDVSFVFNFRPRRSETLERLTSYTAKADFYQMVSLAVERSQDPLNHPLHRIGGHDSRMAQHLCPALKQAVDQQVGGQPVELAAAFSETMYSCNCRPSLGLVAALLTANCRSPNRRGVPVGVRVRLNRESARSLPLRPGQTHWRDVVNAVSRWSHTEFWLGPRPACVDADPRNSAMCPE